MNPNGIMPWSLVSTGVPEWYLKQEFGRARGQGGQEVPLLDLPPKAAALVAAAVRANEHPSPASRPPDAAEPAARRVSARAEPDRGDDSSVGRPAESALTGVPLLRFERLMAVPGVAHGISTRGGGVSSGACATLNVSYAVGDVPGNVDENLRRLAMAFDRQPEQLFWPYQVHGRTVVEVTPSTPGRPRCDVLITRSVERMLLLRFADCTPVLIADPKRRAVAGVHAGWRGSAVRAAEAAVEALESAFGSRPADLVAGIGPAIGPCCYTVGPDVVDAFSDRPWLLQDGKLDLWSANREALTGAGVPAEQIELAAICTQCQSERFFSHRANGGQPAGRFAAVIGLVD
jgi:YfiH family protein